MSDDHKKARTSEATIVIDGVQLSSSQSMTVRVALDSFRDQLFERGLGDDAHGISMVESYTKNAAEVINIIHGEPNPGRAG
ncbi:hypothetical protein RYA05_03030 [Pseudomonas syringae pv. actinidiae]|nr:hypothetical protein [Pseudomonas syringae pv. actinidiae]